MHPLVAKTLEIAAGEIGTHEQGRANWGPRVQEYLKAVEIDFPAPWCAAFVRWCLNTAWMKTDYLTPPILDDLRARDFAYCPYVGAYASREGIIERGPQPGDLFLCFNGKRFSHIGFVKSVTSPLRFWSIEGNSNDEGSAEGKEVCSNHRHVRPGMRFVRWSDELPNAVLPKAVPSGYELVLSGKLLGPMPLVDGKSLVPARLWGQALGFKVGWDADDQVVTFNGEAVDADVTLIDGKAHLPLRPLVSAAELALRVDNLHRRAEVYRP